MDSFFGKFKFQKVMLLSGLPGSGKKHKLVQICETRKLHVVEIDVSSFTSRDALDALAQLLTNRRLDGKSTVVLVKNVEVCTSKDFVSFIHSFVLSNTGWTTNKGKKKKKNCRIKWSSKSKSRLVFTTTTLDYHPIVFTLKKSDACMCIDVKLTQKDKKELVGCQMAPPRERKRKRTSSTATTSNAHQLLLTSMIEPLEQEQGQSQSQDTPSHSVFIAAKYLQSGKASSSMIRRSFDSHKNMTATMQRNCPSMDMDDVSAWKDMYCDFGIMGAEPDFKHEGFDDDPAAFGEQWAAEMMRFSVRTMSAKHSRRGRVRLPEKSIKATTRTRYHALMSLRDGARRACGGTVQKNGELLEYNMYGQIIAGVRSRDTCERYDPPCTGDDREIEVLRFLKLGKFEDDEDDDV